MSPPRVIVVDTGAPAPVVETPPAPEVFHVTQLAFISRFTDAEAIGIDMASRGDTVEAAALRRYQAKVAAGTYIDLQRQDTRAGVMALEEAGLIGPGRALEILDAPIQDFERPKGGV